jgi:hypothetical protein
MGFPVSDARPKGKVQGGKSEISAQYSLFRGLKKQRQADTFCH